MTEDTIPANAEQALVIFESWIRPEFRARRVGISGASVRAWFMRRHGLEFAEAQRLMALVRDARPGVFFEREGAE